MAGEDLSSWFKWIPILWEALRTLAQRHAIAAFFIVFLLSCGVALVVRSWQRAQISERVLTETLGADFEPAPEENKGLEAFLFSDPVVFTLREKLQKAKVSTAFQSLVETLEATWKSSPLTKVPTLQSLCKTQTLCPKVDRVTKDGDAVLSDTSLKHYLFLPTTVLRTPLADDQKKRLLVGQSANENGFLRDDFNSDQNLLGDLAASGYVAETLQDFLTEEVTDDEELAIPRPEQTGIDVVPIQAYLVTRTGVLRITNSQAVKIHEYYQNHFPTNHFFPDRFYYVGALTHLQKSQPTTVDDFFYVSRPYTDLGGFGVVVTLSHAIRVSGHPEAVLCFDLQVSGNGSASEHLASRIHDLGGIAVTVACNAGGLSPPCALMSGLDDRSREAESLRRSLQSRFDWAVRKGEIAMMSGEIQVVRREEGSGVMQVSVPISAPTNPEEKYVFLVGSLNLGKTFQWTRWSALGGFTCIIVAVLLLALVALDILRGRKEVQQAMADLAKMMSDAPTPYVRLDSKDLIRDVNSAFYRLLHVSDLKQLVGVKFKSLCADQASRDRYEKVENQRKLHEEVDPYELALRFGEEATNPVNVMVYGAAIPSTQLGALPETIAVFDTVSGGRPPERSIKSASKAFRQFVAAFGK
jgi:PAS domain-containing protein